MIETRSYFDLCVSEECLSKQNVEKTIKTLYDLGYRTIAVNQLIEDGNIEPKKKKKKGEPREHSDVVPIPFDVQQIKELAVKLNLENFKILNRLTVAFSGQELLHKITKSLNYKKYDIIAALPLTMQAFMFTCSTFEADIITFNPENKLSLKINRKLYNQLVDRNYHFEILYSPAIEDSTKRKNIIHASHIYHSFGKSKNIIISSGASEPRFLRSPYDIINLGLLFGLSDQQCKNAIQHCSRQVVINSVGRRHGKSVMFVENAETEKKDVVVIVESEDEEDMEIDQPALKKSKQ